MEAVKVVGAVRAVGVEVERDSVTFGPLVVRGWKLEQAVEGVEMLKEVELLVVWVFAAFEEPQSGMEMLLQTFEVEKIGVGDKDDRMARLE